MILDLQQGEQNVVSSFLAMTETGEFPPIWSDLRLMAIDDEEAEEDDLDDEDLDDEEGLDDEDLDEEDLDDEEADFDDEDLDEEEKE